jgi:hypothetical protein
MKNEQIPPNPYPVKPPPNMPPPRKESLEAENARLKAEVERLTKAGDAMGEEMLKLNHPHASIYLWCKAKDGKSQP